MIKVVYCCDCCGKEMGEKEYFRQAVLGENVLQEWKIKNVAICSGCAGKIDYALLKFKLSLQEGAEGG